MKLIRTIVHANRVGEMRAALGTLHGASVTVTELRGAVHSRNTGTMLAGNRLAAPVLSNALIELVVRDDLVADVIVSITRATRMGDIGDGHVSVFPLDHESDLVAAERDVV